MKEYMHELSVGDIFHLRTRVLAKLEGDQFTERDREIIEICDELTVTRADDTSRYLFASYISNETKVNIRLEKRGIRDGCIIPIDIIDYPQE